MKSINISSEDLPKYPCLRKATGYDFVVLFTSEGCGTVVWSQCSDWEVGDYDASWVTIESEWEDFDGQIMLSN